MWRDIIVVIGFALTVMFFFGITPRKIGGYSATVRSELTKRQLSQQILFYSGIACSLVMVWAVVMSYRRGDLTFDMIAFFIAGFSAVWYSIFSHAWGLSKKGENIVDMIIVPVMMSSLIAFVVLTTRIPLWEKIVSPLVGASIGAAVGILNTRKSTKHKRESNRN